MRSRLRTPSLHATLPEWVPFAGLLATSLAAWLAAPLAAQGTASADAKTVVERQVDALDRHDVEAAVGTYADALRYGPLSDTAAPTPSSKAQLRQFLSGWWAKNPHSRVTLVETIVVGPFVAAHERLSGAADGKQYEVLDIVEVQGGHIVAEWESADVAALPPSVARDASAIVQRAENAWMANDPDAAAPSFIEDMPMRVLGDTITRRETPTTMRDGFHDAMAKNPHMRYSLIDRIVVGPFYVAHERLTGMADGITRDAMNVFQVHNAHIVAAWENVWLETRPGPS